MNRRFFTSDTHFGHANIINLCNRPFKDFEHMDETLISNWNSVVGVDDHVFHMGDVGMGKWDRWDALLTRLNGHKHLIVGNHDRMFQARPAQAERWNNEYSKWFDTITNSGSLTLENGVQVMMSHFPYNGDSHDGDRFENERLADEGIVLLHGHTHSHETISRSTAGTVQIHVGVDAHDYTPLSEQQVIDYIRIADDIDGNL